MPGGRSLNYNMIRIYVIFYVDFPYAKTFSAPYLTRFHLFFALPSDRETSARQLSQSESEVGVVVGQREMQPGGLRRRQGGKSEYASCSSLRYISQYISRKYCTSHTVHTGRL